jgi:hypothetical protein
MHPMIADGRPRTRFALGCCSNDRQGCQVMREAPDFDELLAAIADCDQARPTAASVKVRQPCEPRQTRVRRSAEWSQPGVAE